jgi:release factor glutamine methyltransferase
MGEVLLSEVVSHAVQKFAAAEIETPQVDAELIAAHILNFSRGEVQAALLTGFTLTEEQTKLFAEFSARRFTREPLQHITGFAYFRQLQLSVGRGVFVPRPETEVVVQIAIDELRASELEAPIAVDLGTGSGAIALSMHTEVAKAQVHAVELSPDAYKFSRQNFDRYPGAELLLGDMSDAFNALNGSVSVVVSNPPYIPNEMVPIDPEVHLFDPKLALYGGTDGLDVVRVAVAAADRLLLQGGLVVIEHADTQSAAVGELLLAEGFIEVRAHKDLNKKDRAVSARKG